MQFKIDTVDVEYKIFLDESISIGNNTRIDSRIVHYKIVQLEFIGFDTALQKYHTASGGVVVDVIVVCVDVIIAAVVVIVVVVVRCISTESPLVESDQTYCVTGKNIVS